MRLHIEIDDRTVARIDKLAGVRGRSQFIRKAIAAVLEREARWKLVQDARGTISDEGHEWDVDPAQWVRSQRRGDRRRVG